MQTETKTCAGCGNKFVGTAADTTCLECDELNINGLSFDRWIRATGRTDGMLVISDARRLLKAWKDGEDPSEHRE